MTRLDTRKCFGRYDGAALDYRDDGGNDEDEDDEDGYDSMMMMSVDCRSQQQVWVGLINCSS